MRFSRFSGSKAGRRILAALFASGIGMTALASSDDRPYTMDFARGLGIIDFARFVAILPVSFNLQASHTEHLTSWPGRKFRFLAYNTWGLPQPFLTHPSRFASLAATIPHLDADVIAFGETFTSYADVLEILDDYPYIAHGPVQDGKAAFWEIDSGLTIISKWPILSTKTVTYSRCSGTDCWASKGALLVRIKIPEIGEVDIATTHLNAGTSAKKDSVRKSQVDELVSLLRTEIGDENLGKRPLIIGGDFNFLPDSANRALLMMGIEGLRDTYADYVADNLDRLSSVAKNGYTYDPARNDNASKMNSSKRIDFIFSKYPNHQRMGTLKSSIALDYEVLGQYLSDHFGVMTDF
ncbi:MAG: endonuclease/exonuclease/phosphatase family protein, partial [Bdellovibrionota bacterium]